MSAAATISRDGHTVTFWEKTQGGQLHPWLRISTLAFRFCLGSDTGEDWSSPATQAECSYPHAGQGATS